MTRDDKLFTLRVWCKYFSPVIFLFNALEAKNKIMYM